MTPRQFSINELERLSGIKAHTIRAWEFRYNLFSPERTLSNRRSYTLHDLSALLDIALLAGKGYRISKLVAAGHVLLREKINSLTDYEDKVAACINDLLTCMYREDIEGLEAILNSNLQASGFEMTIHRIILPFLERANVLSYDNSASEVHFVVTAIRKKIILGIESLGTPPITSRTALLFLIKGEHYDLMLLYLNYVLKANGVRVYYLGTNISIDCFERVLTDKRPDMVLSYVTSRQFDEKEYARVVAHIQPGTALRVCHHADYDPKSELPNLIFMTLKHPLSLIELASAE